jgi:hypothetical protein
MVNPFELESMRPNKFAKMFAILRQHGYRPSLPDRAGLLTIREPRRPIRDISMSEAFMLAKRLCRDNLPG